MKEKIYTIPVNEAFEDKHGCPFCRMAHRLEDERVTYTLGASMMEPDSRMLTNSLGFCGRHFKMLSEKPNKLSLALVLDTHLANVRNRLEASGAGVMKNEKSGGLFRKKSTDGGAVLSAAIGSAVSGCAVCKSVDATMERYFDVFFYMWETEEEFREKFALCDGMCLPHYNMLLQKSRQYLSADSANRFTAELYEKQEKLFAQLQEDIHKFTLKFDYRNKDMPWGSAKDAPKRVIEYLSGEKLGGEENENE